VVFFPFQRASPALVLECYALDVFYQKHLKTSFIERKVN
jgi:hypothetical protein